MLAAADASPDAEVCGLLLGTSERVNQVLSCANVAGDPRRTFEIDPVALFAAMRAERGGGPCVIGYWHSHPSGDINPSVTDAASAAPDGKVWVIVSGDRISAWRAEPGSGVATTRFSPLRLVETE